jgi:hypothetical protein
MAVRALYQDPFSPVLLNSTPVVLSDEQRHYIREILDIACSDSKFADKAYDAIRYVLSAPSVILPVVSSLSPGSATVGDADFILQVMGTGFTPESVIVFNGGEEVTTYVSATQLTTGVNMSTVTGAFTVPVAVLSKEGVLSNAVNFVFQDSPALLGARKSTLTEAKVVPPAPSVKK